MSCSYRNAGHVLIAASVIIATIKAILTGLFHTRRPVHKSGYVCLINVVHLYFVSRIFY